MHVRTSDIERYKNKVEGVLERSWESVKSCTGVAGFSLAAGRLGPVKGVPLDLGAGVILHIVGGLAPSRTRRAAKITEGMQDLADDALCSYFARIAHTIGSEWKVSGKLSMPTRGLLESVAGEEGGESMMGGALADQELARMVAAGRK